MDSTHTVSARDSHALTPCLTPADRPRTWIRRIDGGGAIATTCPSWCTDTHWNDQGKMLVDLSHSSAAVAMRVATRVDGDPDPVAWPVMSAAIKQWPYLEDAEDREPYVAFEPSPDDVIEMDPDRLAAMIGEIRAHADRLEQVHAQLVDAVTQHRAAHAVTA